VLTRNLTLGVTGLLVWVAAHRFLQLQPSKATLFVAVGAAVAYAARRMWEDYVDGKHMLTTAWKVGAADLLTVLVPCIILAGVVW
jgi:hypothetical protein